MKIFVANSRFALKPIAAAVALAASAGVALAAPTPNQMPGAGQLQALSLGSAGTSITLNTIGAPIIGLVSGGGIGIDGKVVLRWGGTGAPVDATNPAGFNLGQNATLLFGAVTANSAVLNIDASGNPSQIYGSLVSTAGPIPAVGAIPGCGACAFAPSIAVANANGIVVAAGARIVVPPPSGLILLGVDMNNSTSVNEFVANNTWVSPAPPVLGVSYISFGGVSPNGNISIAGAINGDLVTNTPSKYIFVAGNNIDVMNTGNLFANKIVLQAGLYPTAQSGAVGGVSNVTVNRYWVVEEAAPGVLSCCTINDGNKTLQIDAAATGNITNLGSISDAGIIATDYLLIGAKGNIRSGTLGDTNPTIGLFSDIGTFIDSYQDTSKVELYGNVTGYTTNKTLPFLQVNYFARYSPVAINPDVVVNAIKPGGQPSTITTTDNVSIFGGNIAINSTINHKANSAGGVQNDVDLVISASKTLSITADIGAGQDVYLSSGGTMTISGNVLSDTNEGGAGGIYIYNNGAGAATTISGNLTTPLSTSNSILVETYGPTTISGKMTTLGGGSVSVYNYGTGAGNFTTISGNVSSTGAVYIYNGASPANPNPLTVSGNVTAVGNVRIGNLGSAFGNATTVSGDVTSTDGNILVENYGLITGNLTITGTLNAYKNVNIFSDGNAQVRAVVAGSNISAEVDGTSLVVDGPWTAGSALSILGTLATTSLKPAGVLTAKQVNLTGLNFKSVNAAGNSFISLGQKPAMQIVTNDLNVSVTGSINGPVAGTTNWLSNSIDVAPLVTLAPVFVSVTANGGGFQAVNIRVLGDEIFDTAATVTPFIGVPATTGGFPAGGLQGNLGSQLIIQANGFLKILGTPTFSLTGPPLAAQFPGGAAFLAGTTLELLTPFYNAWSVASPPFGGSFFSAPYIALSGYIATSGTAWANFSTMPVTGNPTVYQIRALTANSFGFEATTAFAKNDYRSTVVGGPVCGTSGPTTWTVCP